MSSAQKPKSPLSEAAAAFERELAVYEKLSHELEKSPVRSEKSLHRARRLLGEASESEQRLQGLLQDLSKAMVEARDRQQECMARVVEAMRSAQRRADEFTQLLERVAALGAKAKDVNEPVGRVLAQKAEGGDQDALLASLEEVDQSMQGVVHDADAVFQAANEGDWPEVARDVRSLQQQVQSVLAKVHKARTDVAMAEQVTIIDRTSSN